MAYSLTLPNGAVINNIPDNISRNQAMDMLKEKMPDAFPQPPGVLSQLVRSPIEIGKGFIRGLTTDPLSGISSLAYTGARAAGAELTPFEQTAFGRGLGEAQTALAPSDTGMITQLAGGLGSLASFIPGGLLKGGIRLATLGTQAAGLGSEEARARAEQARLEGKEVTPEQQFISQVGGTGIGLTELAPVANLIRPIEAVLRGVKRSDADAIAPGLFNSARRILETGGIEAFQEGMANIMQDLVQKGVYDPNLEVGESALGDAAMGGAVGSFAQGAIELVTRGKRRDIYERLKAQEREQELQDRLARLQSEEQEQIARTKANLGVPEETLLALPAPAAPVIDAPTQDPLANPLGNFSVDELTTGISDFINAKRKKDGQSTLDSFSIEDIADAGAPQAEIDRIIAGKLSQQGVNVEEGLAQNPSEQDVRNLAESKGISTDTPGYRHFLSRTTGVEDYGSMSPMQRLAAFTSLQNVEEGGILPLGTNAKRFTEQQYDKVKTSIPDLFKDSDTLSPTSVVEQVKKMTGLKSDRDARSLLDTAIRNGELSTAATPVYEVIKDGVILRKYNTRKAAAESADRLNATVRNSTVTEFALPGTLKELPGGPDIRAGRFEAGVEPAGFDIKDATGKTLGGAATQAEAEAKATRFAATRQGEANRLQEEIQKIKEGIARTQQRLEAMEATGQAGTVGFTKLQADAFAQAKEAQRKIEKLSAQQAALAEPLSINSKGTRPVSREGYTFFQDGQPRGTFPTKEAAEEAAIQSYDDSFLERIANSGDQQRGLMPKRLAAMARNELARRRGELPQGFGIQYTGTPEEAEAKLSQAGVFTAKTQEQIRELEKKLLPAMKKLGLENVGLRIIKAIESGQGSADGFYASRLITIALDAVDPMGTLRHESIHALKNLGAFKPNEWKVLEKKAKEEWIDRFLKDRFTAQGVSLFDAYKAIYEQDNGSLAGFDEYITEEAIADAFKYFNQTKPPAGLIANLMYRLKRFFSALENAFKGLGFQTAEDVFTRTEEGGLQPIRAEGVDRDGIKKFSVGATPDPAINIITGQTPKPNFGKKAKVEDVGNYFDRLIRDEFGGPLDFRNPEHFDRAVSIANQELQYQRELENSGIDWYDRDIADAFEITMEVLPQLSSPIKRNLFNVMAGIMSPGTNARDNWFINAKAFKHYLDTGTIPSINPENNKLWQGGLESANKKKQLDMLNAMVQDMGEVAATEWVYSEHPVSEINDFRSRYGGFTSKVSGKASDQKSGMLAFGPKVGPFIANINGIHAETVDRWMIRTFNRYFGTMVGADGNIVDIPTGEPQRKAAQELLRRVGNELGVRPYQAQSMLWFFEQSLFRAMGTTAPSYGFSDGARRYRDDTRARRDAEEGRAVGAPSDAKPDTRYSLRPDELAGRPSDRGISAQRAGDRGGRDQGRSNTPLEGSPVVQGATGPDPNLVSVAERYAQDKQIPYRRQGEYVDVNPEFGARVAQAYEEMAHDPSNPLVREAYSDLIRQTRDQYEALINDGYQFTFYDSNTDPYAGNPFNAMRDLRANKTMAVYGTYAGYGTEGITGAEVANNPMLEDTGLRWPDQAGNPQIVTANDLFRAVHDAFGHGLEGAGFRARGEENAFQAHARLFTGPALGALASETRGQNSWLNFGPYGEQNANAKVLDTVFAEQKTGLMPSWTWTTNMAPDMGDKRLSLRVEPLEGISIREKQPGSQSFDVVHYGKKPVTTLSGSMYGTGIRGAEASRVFSSEDPRIRKRVYFYTPRPDGRMPVPEAGLGNQVYVQRLNNILGPGPEMQALASQATDQTGQMNANDFESSVIDAGYDGYAVPNMGMLVVLDANVPVITRGTRQEVRERAPEDSIKIGDQRYSLRAVNTPEFKQWFGSSTITNPDGTPKVMYHGTARDIGTFVPKQANAIFLTPKPDFARDFAGTSKDYMIDEMFNEGLSSQERFELVKNAATRLYREKEISKSDRDSLLQTDPEELALWRMPSTVADAVRAEVTTMLPSGENIMPLFVRAEKPFDYMNPEHTRRVAEVYVSNEEPKYILQSLDLYRNAELDNDGQPVDYIGERNKKSLIELVARTLERGNWDHIELDEIQEIIRYLKFDSFYVVENGQRNLAVYDPNQVKSAVGNFGAFSRTNNDIRYSLALAGINPQSSLVPDEGGDSLGRLGMQPQKLGGRPINLLIGTHNDLIDELKNEKMYRPVSYGANHILNRVLNNPRRDPGGAQELLERIVRKAQQIARNYSRVYKEGNKLIFFAGNDSLITMEDGSIVTMYRQFDPERKYGNPIWFGRAPAVTDSKPPKGLPVRERDGLVSPKDVETAEKVKRVYTPMDVETLAAAYVEPKKGTLGLKRLSLRSTDTPAFKRWFGDSKIVDADGNPLVVYHGTDADITEFKKGKKLKSFPKFNTPQKHLGHFFTDDSDYAERYAGRGFDKEDAVIMPVYLSIQNPKIEPLSLIDEIENKWTMNKAIAYRSRLEKEGYDGIIFEGIAKIGPIREIVAFRPEQIKSATGNEGTFDPTKRDIRLSLRESVDPAIVDAIDRTTTTRQEQGFGDRMAEAISPTGFTKFRQGFINKYERIAQISRTVAKKFGDQELLADQSAIAAALMSDRASGVAAEAFKRGIPVYDKGYTYVTDMEGQQKGLMQILMPLAERGDPFVYQAFQFYAASKRGKRLDAEGRERLFTPDDMKKAALLEREFPEFKQVFDDYQKFNKGLVDYMKDTGVIDAEMARKWTENWDYIPFYRQLDGERTAGPNIFQSIAGVALPKKLKGGEAPLADFLETITRNTRAAIEAGMKNVAANRVVRDMKRLNDPGGTAPMIEEIKPGQRLGPDSITVRENGKTKNYRVADPLLIESLKGLNIPQLPFLEVLAKPAQVLRELVTKDPGFMMANLLRDSLQAWGIGNQIFPVVDTFKQYAKVLANMSPEAQKLMRAGIGTGYEFKGDVQATTAEFARQLRIAAGQRTAGEKAALPLTKAWDLLDQASTASDLATRAEVFKRTMEETNGNEAEAVFQAMEVMNFSRKGSNPIIQIAAAAIPFLNARIQGLDVLYRAGTGQLSARNAAARQKAFFVRGMTMMALSSLYWMLASETEEWQTAEQETRDNNWIIGPVRIPIPFELGVIFKVAPERILEYTFGDDTTKDLKMSFVRNLTSTLAVNPIPQAILPIVENVANYSFFTGQPIVGRGLEDVSKPFQVNTGTSLFASKAGESLGLSPVQIDNLIRGYTGTLGGYAVMALDAVMRGQGDPTKATMGAEQLPVVKRFFASPESTGTVTQFYELKNKLDETTRTINFLERAGKFDQMAEYMKENAMMVSMTPYIRTLEKEMNMLRDTKRVVNNSQMEPDQKREVLDAIRSAEVNLTRNIQSVRKLVD